MKATSEGGQDDNGTYMCNKLDAEVADSYSPPVLESNDVPDLQRNRVSAKFLTFTFFDVFQDKIILCNK